MTQAVLTTAIVVVATATVGVAGLEFFGRKWKRGIVKVLGYDDFPSGTRAKVSIRNLDGTDEGLRVAFPCDVAEVEPGESFETAYLTFPYDSNLDVSCRIAPPIPLKDRIIGKLSSAFGRGVATA